MSKIPELKMFVDPEGHEGGDVVVSHPASTSRCVSNVSSVGLSDPNWADAGTVQMAIAVATVSVAKSLFTTPSLENLVTGKDACSLFERSILASKPASASARLKNL
jgi:hypothetical protein